MEVVGAIVVVGIMGGLMEPACGIHFACAMGSLCAIYFMCHLQYSAYIYLLIVFFSVINESRTYVY